MPAVFNLRSYYVFSWIPPSVQPRFKITIERNDGTIDDVTDICSFRITDGATEGIGTFEITLPNPNETYTGVYTGMEIVRYYCDYATTATTLRFRGRVEKPSNQNNSIKLTGRSEALFVVDRTVTKQYGSTDAGSIIEDLFNTYGVGRFTTTNVDLSTGVNLTKNWIDKPFWECITEVCNDTGYDCYVSALLDVHFFLVGSVDNDYEAFVHDMNIFEVGDFAPDLQFVKNRVRVYGALVDGVQIMATANDLDSQASYGIRTKPVNDSSISDEVQAKALAEAVLLTIKDPPIVGNVRGFLLATIQPGDNMWISAPYDGLNPARRRIISYTHELNDDEGLVTEVSIEREQKKISTFLRDRVVAESGQANVSSNPADMDYSYGFLFDSDSGTHSSTVISSGSLRATAASCNWLSPSRVLDNNLYQVYISATGEKLNSAAIYVAADGVNFQLVPLRTTTTISSTGQAIQIKVIFSDSTASVDSLNVQYTTN